MFFIFGLGCDFFIFAGFGLRFLRLGLLGGWFFGVCLFLVTEFEGVYVFCDGCELFQRLSGGKQACSSLEDFDEDEDDGGDEQPGFEGYGSGGSRHGLPDI